MFWEVHQHFYLDDQLKIYSNDGLLIFSHLLEMVETFKHGGAMFKIRLLFARSLRGPLS